MAIRIGHESACLSLKSFVRSRRQWSGGGRDVDRRGGPDEKDEEKIKRDENIDTVKRLYWMMRVVGGGYGPVGARASLGSLTADWIGWMDGWIEYGVEGKMLFFIRLARKKELMDR